MVQTGGRSSSQQPPLPWTPPTASAVSTRSPSIFGATFTATVFPSVRLDPQLVLFVFLPVLLFEGAWSTHSRDLAADGLLILLLAVPGLGLSVAITASVLHIGLGLSWLIALLLGAVISPTDPIAVLALFRQLGLPRRLQTLIEGESLFNDGIAAAVVTTVLAIALATTGPVQSAPPWQIALGALWMVIGGPTLGHLLGLLVAYLLRFLDDHLIETTATVAVAYGAYVLSELAHTSGLLAVVGTGLVLSNYGRRWGMSERTQDVTADVWEVAGYLGNSLLFLLVGVEIGASAFMQALPAIGWAVVGVLTARAVMIYGIIGAYNVLAQRISRLTTTPRWCLLGPAAAVPSRWRPVLLFSGLRGALSLALVSSLPATIPQRTLLAGAVYGVVLVTLVGQGVGMRLLLPWWRKVSPPPVTSGEQQSRAT